VLCELRRGHVALLIAFLDFLHSIRNEALAKQLTAHTQTHECMWVHQCGGAGACVRQVTRVHWNQQSCIKTLASLHAVEQVLYKRQLTSGPLFWPASPLHIHYFPLTPVSM
jgi:hypothetical protein